jgi:ubiquinone/menaquinone biosynthesis C-methylase UbiE
MTQNIYDNPEFYEGYSQLRRSVEGLAGAPEWPALRALLPDLRGLNVVDLGCGYGWFCRWAREQGAAQVLGLDVSEKMLAQATAATLDTGLAYARADMEKLELPEASFDVAYSSLALHYIKDLAGLFATVHRALVPHGAWSSRSSTRSIWPQRILGGWSAQMAARPGLSTAICWKGRVRQIGWRRALSSNIAPLGPFSIC